METTGTRFRFILDSWQLLAAALVVWIVVIVLLWPFQSSVLNWDEIDYLNAARLGVGTNAVEKGSLTVPEFVRLANAKRSGGTYAPPGYDENNDPFLLRHFHPPLVVYFESVIIRWFDQPSERVVRFVQMLGAFVLILTMFISYRRLAGGLRWTGTIVLGCIAVWMCEQLFSSLQFHGWAAVWSVAAPALLSAWLDQPKPITGVLLSLSVALSALTLETGAIVLVGILACLVLWKPKLDGSQKSWWRTCVIGLALIVFFVVVLWPGALITLSPLKTLAMYVYRIRLGAEYSNVSFRSIMTSLTPLLVLVVPAAVWLLYACRSEARRWGPYVVIGAVYAIALTKFAIGPHYLLPAFAPLAVVTGFASDRLRSRTLRAFVALAVVVLLGYGALAHRLPMMDSPFRQDLDFLRANLRGRQTLAVGAHIFRYYVGNDYEIRPITLSYDGALQERRNGQYFPLVPADVAGKIIVILDRPGNKGIKAPEASLLAGCAKRRTNIVRVYDCGQPF